MKSKGFVFVETIVVIVVLSLGLVMVYQSFANVIANYKRRAAYNDIAYIYRTYYLEDFITSLNIEKFINYYLGPTSSGGLGKTIQEFSCQNALLYNIESTVFGPETLGDLSFEDQGKMTICQSLMADYKVKRMYISNYNVNELKKCTTRQGKTADSCKTSVNKDALNTMSPSMIYFLRTLNGTESNTYRLIVEYEEDVIDSDSTVQKVMIGGNLQCPSTFQRNSETDVCEKNIKKRYYSSVALINKNK